ncbi:MAG: CDP-diacylglycerol--glycerol-3-phosphate 3-phosphatidyltransferase [Clostridia bacterium]|nr:CDP-diacylglycerol--glycerol-3-phosphate 3-phosphatidyltransferase [Clostridia bacterium]
MNLPNKLTIFRIILVPFFVAFLLIEFPNNNIVSAILFVIASLTDFLDGYIARKNNLVTDFGKFADPIADKILVISACVCLVEKGVIPAWSVLIIIFREFVISGLRMAAASKNVVIPADKLGKLKTLTQMIALILLILDVFNFLYIPYILYYISIVLTFLSGVMYIVKAKDIIL